MQIAVFLFGIVVSAGSVRYSKHKVSESITFYSFIAELMRIEAVLI